MGSFVSSNRHEFGKVDFAHYGAFKFSIYLFSFADLMCRQIWERAEGKAGPFQCYFPLKLALQMQLSGAASP